MTMTANKSQQDAACERYPESPTLCHGSAETAITEAEVTTRCAMVAKTAGKGGS